MLNKKRQSLFFVVIFHLIAITLSQQQNILVTLIGEPRFKFSLISSQNYIAWTGWQYFPQLYHRFILDKDQFVYISKKVMVNFCPNIAKSFGTRVLIDDIIHPNFNGMTGDLFVHDHSQEHSVWLKKGIHTVIVQYNTNGVFPIQAGNHDKEVFYNHLKVVYFKGI